jgi:hypothetical protein
MRDEDAEEYERNVLFHIGIGGEGCPKMEQIAIPHLARYNCARCGAPAAPCSLFPVPSSYICRARSMARIMAIALLIDS